MSSAAPSPCSSASPEKLLFQSVLFQALLDATSPSTVARYAETRDRAKRWFQEGRKDFRWICWLAGFDPEEVRSAYLDDRINREALRGELVGHHASRRPEGQEVRA
ncbi:hypothetical protein RSK20926_11679 [Roseobacter sp. SK209-2-6]|uniref:hypothetical protein n=1 Tax=Roseobacter sp. SK209-2-6 TaxID=388739 RepID=UPI0000F3C5AB|nr:hypothetical protein [Roseobacter sp. SK209-2-6]EBA18377.1 hypothetical protein RSK20926_11679 [Roseobacter sp. SK209-2-6]